MNVPLWIALMTVTLAAIAAWAGVRARRVGNPLAIAEPAIDALDRPRAASGHGSAPLTPQASPHEGPIPPEHVSRLGLVSVYSAKGGSGVSTLAVNLAIGIRRQRNLGVVLADLDSQSGDAAFLLGISCAGAIRANPESGRVNLASVLNALVEHESGIHLLPQSDRIEPNATEPQQVASILGILTSLYDTVIVDTPHALNQTTLEILRRSGDVLLVVEPNVPAVRAARRAIEALDRQGHAAVAGRVLVIVNRFTADAPVTLEQIEATLGMPVFATIAEDDAAVSDARNLGQPLGERGASSGAARDIVALARRLAGDA